MHFDVGNGKRGRKWRKREEIEREWGNVESQSLSISSFSLHFLLISSFSLHFLAARLQGCNDLCSPASVSKVLRRDVSSQQGIRIINITNQATWLEKIPDGAPGRLGGRMWITIDWKTWTTMTMPNDDLILSRWFDDTLMTIQSKLNDLLIMRVTQTMWAEAEDRARARARMQSWRACPSWLNTFLCLWQLIIYQFGEAVHTWDIQRRRKEGAIWKTLLYFRCEKPGELLLFVLALFLLFFLAYYLEELGDVKH